ncbi:MAG TPA: hypothetical protein VNG69_15445 [Casimicrobiaceae bacterium]|nr:hypothetical protein [Casimicrobiaceae bacterium]
MSTLANMGDARSRLIALVLAALGLALIAYVEFALTNSGADRFGWFIYESAAWLALLFIGPFLPVGTTVLVAALVALGLEVFAYHRVFVLANADDATIYLWKPLVQLALIAGAWLGGYLMYLRSVRESANG